MRCIKFGILFTSLVMLTTGCGEKTLSCSVDTEDTGKYELVMNFDSSDKLNKLKMNTLVDMGIEMSEDEALSLCDAYGSDEFVSCDVEVDGTEITLVMEYDILSAGDDFSKGITGEEDGYKQIKKYFEEDGYTCK